MNYHARDGGVIVERENTASTLTERSPVHRRFPFPSGQKQQLHALVVALRE
ncbi:hypothetical protein ACFQL7_09795 [Halocatena marina]|uniref:Uncharacterized protein n=1 Tax=Halocatena marina TaxID=2934937 RepID=A0ABD5YLK0_9EURY